MITPAQDNIVEADAEALVNTVNCVGVMGKGIALQFKQAFPDNFAAYERACRAGEVQPGRMLVVPTGRLGNPQYIINFPTKRHWRARSKLRYVEDGLASLIGEVQRLGIRSIAVPPLGCGNGGLAWSDVEPLIRGAFAAVPDVHLLLFPPKGAPEAAAMPVRTERPAMTRARALLIEVLTRYGVEGYRLAMLEVQKLAYFLQAAGEPLRLNFVKHKYGPYAENLHPVLQRLEGHFLRGYGDRSGHEGIFVLPGASEAARAELAHTPAALERLERVSRLIEGFETPYGMELLATVHWQARVDPSAAADPERAVELVHAWNSRKRQTFKPEHIKAAWQRLHDHGWLTVADGAPLPLTATAHASN
jgi:O-acetyl-ADP-ribose deacetylase (regulator of RNase III)